MNVLVMGGSRFMGPAIVHRLLERQHNVVLFNRGTRSIEWPDGVTEIHGDRNSDVDLEQLRRLELDGVIDMSALTADQTESLLRVVGNVPRFVHCSSGAVYAPPVELPWPEDSSGGPWPLWGSYAVGKFECERSLQRHRSGIGVTTLIRPPYVLGRENYVDREEFVLNRLLDGAEILLPVDGQAVQQFVTTNQVGYAMVAALETFQTGGIRVFNIASPGFVSLRGFVELCAAATNTIPQLRAVPAEQSIPESGVFNPANPVFPFPNVNYVLDIQASIHAGIAPPPVSILSMVEDALEALLSNPERRKWARTKAELAFL